MSRVLLLPEGPREWGSSRLRVWWLADAWDRAEVVKTNDQGILDLTDVCAVVTQQKLLRKPWDKLYQVCKDKGVPLIADICDPMWWFTPQSRDLYKLCDFAVCSSEKLVSVVREELNLPAICIPDRHEPSAFVPKQEYHTDVPIVMWHGVVLNRAALWNCTVELHRLVAAGHKFRIAIVDNAATHRCDWLHMLDEENQPMPVEYVEWNLESFYRDVLPKADIGLVPPFPGAWGKLKSSNKETCFWMAGVPTTTGTNMKELAELIRDADLRERLGRRVRAAAMDRWNIERSVEEWERLMKVLVPSW